MGHLEPFKKTIEDTKAAKEIWGLVLDYAYRAQLTSRKTESLCIMNVDCNANSLILTLPKDKEKDDSLISALKKIWDSYFEDHSFCVKTPLIIEFKDYGTK